MIFWILPNKKNLAFIPRTGSTAWGQTVLDTFYPNDRARQEHASTPDDELAIPQYFIPHTRNPEGVLLGISRNPLERFRSGFTRAANGRTVDELIADLVSGKERPVNIHIRPVSIQFGKYLDKMKWFSYESGLADLAKEVGLDKLPETLNESSLEDKPVLNDTQKSKLQELYAEDFKIWNKANGN